MTDLIRRALMGDKQAQNECTAQYIALPCPFCGKEMKKCIQDRTYQEGAIISEVVYEHPKCDCLLSEDWVNAGDITIWNRRAAPPAESPTGWIDVKDKLPERFYHLNEGEGQCKPMEFIVFVKGASFATIGAFTGAGFVASPYSDTIRFSDEVTHWMPLPEPPKEAPK